MNLPAIITFFGLTYAGVGVLFGVWFVWRGAAGLDPVAAHATRGFRAIILPGAAALWPVLLVSVVRARRPA